MASSVRTSKEKVVVELSAFLEESTALSYNFESVRGPRLFSCGTVAYREPHW